MDVRDLHTLGPIWSVLNIGGWKIKPTSRRNSGLRHHRSGFWSCGVMWSKESSMTLSTPCGNLTWQRTIPHAQMMFTVEFPSNHVCIYILYNLYNIYDYVCVESYRYIYTWIGYQCLQTPWVNIHKSLASSRISLTSLKAAEMSPGNIWDR